jgi:hypothetical protein
MTIVTREDLSKRRGLSKSALTTFAICPNKSFNAKHFPRPFISSPKIVFGSCVDAAVEVLIACARADLPIDIDRALAAALEVEARDQIEVDQAEVEQAVRAFASDVMPRFDWHLVRTQAHIRLPLFDWGEVDGHPDIIFPAPSVWDVKTSSKPKPTAMTVELGMYALMVEEETGSPVVEVGYLTWVRGTTKYWQGFGPDEIGQRALKTGANKGQMVETGHHIPSTYVDDEFRRWTKEQVSAYVRYDRADDLMNQARIARKMEPENYSFGGLPMNFGLCRDCQFAPALGGSCRLAPARAVETD